MTSFTSTELATIWFSAYAKSCILGHSPRDCKNAAWKWLDGLFLTHDEKKPLWSFFDRMEAGEKLELSLDVHGKEHHVVATWDRTTDIFPSITTQYKLF